MKHPSQHRGTVNWLYLLIGLFGAPAAWFMQMLSSEILSSHACYPATEPLVKPVWSSLHEILISISAASFFIGLFSLTIAWITWKRTRNEAKGKGEHTMQTGEGRTRFLALLGFFTSIMLLITIIFTAFAILLGRPC